MILGSDAPVTQESLLEALRYEIHRALRTPAGAWQRQIVDTVLQTAMLRVVRLALQFNQTATRSGFARAGQELLPVFVKAQTNDEPPSSLPREGPLIIAANHPGSVDALLVAARANRPDVKLIARAMPFLRQLPGVQNCLIDATRDTTQRMLVLRQALGHLEQGGCLLLFASGNLDPDPALMPGAEAAIARWTGSAAFLIKRIPTTRLVVAITSQIIAPRLYHSPLLALHKNPWDRQFMAELLQTSLQVLFPGKFQTSPKVTFSPAFTLGDAAAALTADLHQQILALAIQELARHPSNRR